MTKKYAQVYKNTSDLIPYVNNSRTHSDAQINQIASSIKEFGFTNPVLIDESNGVIAGHGRIIAAQKLNIDELPCIVLNGLTDAQRKAYVIADNKIALNSQWNEDMLAIEIEALRDMDYDIDILGFTDGELSDLFDDEEDSFEELDDDRDDDFDDNEENLVIVECISEIEQQQLYTELSERGFKLKVLD